MALDLTLCVPQDLVATATLEDLADAIEAVDEWSERPAGVLDYVYRHRVLALLTGPHEERDLLRILEHLRWAANPARAPQLDALDRPYARLWHGYADLLESRIHVLRARDPDRIRRRAHVEEILRILEKRGRNQKQIGDELGLRKANLTRILNLMEQNGLIVRRRKGRRNRVELHPTEAERRSRDREQVADRSPAPRGLDYLVGPRT